MAEEPRAILLRTPRTPDPYRDVLEAAGFQVHVVPVLSFTFIHQGDLRRALSREDRYGGLVATSPRAVEALRRTGRSFQTWNERSFYAAGPETARRAAALGFSPRGQESGSAEELAEFIVDRSIEKPLLFLSGNRRRDTLPDRLETAGVPFEELVVYETHLRRQLDWPLDRVKRSDWVVFFSPSGIKAARRDRSIPWHRLRKGAIGRTTSAALEDEGWSVDAVADAPEPEALCRALVRAAQTPRDSQ